MSLIPFVIGVIGSEELFQKSLPFKEGGWVTPFVFLLAKSDQDSPEIIGLDNDEKTYAPTTGSHLAATYMLRNCSVIIILEDGHKIASKLCQEIKTIKKSDIFPLDTPSSGYPVPSLELPNPALVLHTPDEIKAFKRQIGKMLEKQIEAGQKPAQQLIKAMYMEVRHYLNPHDHSGQNEENSLNSLCQQFACLEGFNRECDAKSESLFKEEQLKWGLPDSSETLKQRKSLREIDGFHQKADNHAVNFQVNWQKMSFASLKELMKSRIHPSSLLFMGWMAALLLTISTESLELLRGYEGWNLVSPVSFMLYVIILLWGLIYFLHAKVERWENKHQDYRLLAEGLRIQFYWNLAFGAVSNERMKSYVADWLPTHLGEIGWVRQALHTIRFINQPYECQADPWDAIKNFIAVQIDYNEKTYIQRRENVADELDGFAKYFVRFFGVTLLLLTVHAIAEISEAHWIHTVPVWLHHVVVGVMIVSLVVAVTLHEIKEGYALEPESRRGNATLRVLKNAKEMWDQHDKSLDVNEPQYQKILFELGQHFLRDQADWLFLHRERPIQPSHG